ncbi:MAG: hypothetical protein JPMHGGIA_02821 [Saprospiraceae bacterium]|nr:hypothetical protein [Saprospiraceae bacterium]
MKLRFIIINLFWLHSFFVWSQNKAFHHDWKQLIEFYVCSESKEIEANYFLYETHTNKTVNSTTHSLIKSKGDQIHQEIEGMISIVNPEYMIYIDEEEKLILLDRTPKNLFNFIQMLQIDTSAFPKANIVLLKQSTTTKSYSLSFDNGIYEKIEINFHPSTYHLQKLIIFYATSEALDVEKPDHLTKPRMEIHYKPFRKVQLPFYTVDNNPFAIFDGQSIKAKKAYQKYQCVDNRIKFK